MRGSVRALLASLLVTLAPLAVVGPAAAANDLTVAYNSQTDRDFRQGLQMRLAWTGDYAGLFDADIGPGTLRAIRDFQARHGLQANGVIDEPFLRLLVVESDRAQQALGFSFVEDELTGAEIGLPSALVRDLGPTEIGRLWRSPQDNVEVETVRFADGQRSLAEMYDLVQTPQADRTVDYKKFAGTWFVVSGTEAGGRTYYIRVASRGPELRGFSVSYTPDMAAKMQPFVIVASNMFDGFAGEPATGAGSALVAGLTRGGDADRSALAYAERGSPTRAEPASAQGGAPAAASQNLDSSGTGFLVSKDGWVLTNAHVAKACHTILVGDHGAADNRIIDSANDLALLHVASGSDLGEPLKISTAAPRLGEDILALGFPLRTILADSLNVTRGNVSSLLGLMNDPRYLQISAPVQPGNSGGPLVDLAGRVVGVVTAKLNAVAVADVTGDIPQAINFAIRPDTVTQFLDANAIDYAKADASAAFESVPDATAKVQNGVLPILCLGG
ncbi:serine protease [Aurantimonas sp. MSK8Z-1]|uniref:serine protease n=1 Tax=Mangrovibrevibacter kandeliae TaxID=2968473 RepID=UPI0021185517|nr:serine protease [Aurantimonas sp. MSK8Z-1]MCW4116024.1 serine protease [Aurantimonas sp. MSK8Z-1]